MKNLAAQVCPLLIVEDSRADFETITLLLREAGLKSPILHCQTGEEALDFMATMNRRPHAERQLPVHILLDLNLPGISGLEVLDELRGDNTFRPVPVTILTTSSHPSDITGCYRAGANSYLIKPVNFERLEKMLHAFTEYWFEVAELSTQAGVYA